MFFKKKKKVEETVVEHEVESVESIEALQKRFNELFKDVDYSDVQSWTKDEYDRISKIKENYERGFLKDSDLSLQDEEKVMKLYKMNIEGIIKETEEIDEETKKIIKETNEINEETENIIKETEEIKKETEKLEERINKFQKVSEIMKKNGLNDTTDPNQVENIEFSEEDSLIIKETLDDLAKNEPETLKKMVEESIKAYPDKASEIMNNYKAMYPEIFK